MIEFARLALLIVILAFSVQANERAKEVVEEIKAAKEAKAANILTAKPPGRKVTQGIFMIEGKNEGPTGPPQLLITNY